MRAHSGKIHLCALYTMNWDYKKHQRDKSCLFVSLALSGLGLDVSLNTHPRWKLYFRRFCTDYQLTKLSLTIFSQIYHTIRDDVERLEGKLDKQMIRIVWNLRKSFLTHCAIYYLYCFIVNFDKMNFNPIWERICLKLLEFKKDEKYRGKESHKKREPSLLGSHWYRV